MLSVGDLCKFDPKRCFSLETPMTMEFWKSATSIARDSAVIAQAQFVKRHGNLRKTVA